MIQAGPGLEAEATRRDCFLCRPNATLLADVSVAGYTMAGLGPLAEGYAVVATHEHLRGLAAATTELRRAYSAYATNIALKLSARYGECFVVEHGNMAVCGVDDVEGRIHCFHPHFLLVPDRRCDVAPFYEYFGSNHKTFGSLEEAVHFGADNGQYLLAGNALGPFHVFLPDGELPRQFARGLIADQLGEEHRASWRDEPDTAWTGRNATSLRALLR
jgi:hypothetical protein